MLDSYYSIVGKESFDSHKETLGKIFKGGDRYQVPPNQRDYEWNLELLEEFWNDLINSLKSKEKAYFFGSTIFQKDEDDDFTTIYDGQQRLATLTILWAVIRNMLYQYKKDENAKTIDLSYINQRTEKGRQTPILTLNLRNKDFFNDCIQQCPIVSFDAYENIHGKLNKSNEKIKNCYIFFQKMIEQEFKNMNLTNKEKKVEFITDISEHLRENFILVVIAVRSEDEAYMVYESINQKRLELSVADLFKNYLIRKTKDAKQKEEIISIWKDIADGLDSDIRPFLKHYWHSKKGVITLRRLFKELKIFIEKEGNDPHTLIKELNGEAIIYSALKREDKDYWSKKELQLVKDFNKLAVEQPLPVLMIAKKKFSKEDFISLLKTITNFSFRYNIICNLPPNVLEKTYSDIARGIRGENLDKDKKQIKTEKEVKDLLKKYYPQDLDFEKKFLGKTIEKNKLALYMWSRINRELTTSEKIDETELSDEHILPQKPNDEWKKYLKDKGIMDNEKINELIYRIGNQTAMDVKMNRKAKNKFFDKKRDEHYKNSKMIINEELKSIKDWTEKDISNREKKYFPIVKEIWKIEFS